MTEVHSWITNSSSEKTTHSPQYSEKFAQNVRSALDYWWHRHGNTPIFQGEEYLQDIDEGALLLASNHRSVSDIYLDGEILFRNTDTTPYYLPRSGLYMFPLNVAFSHLPTIQVPQHKQGKEERVRAIKEMNHAVGSVLANERNLIGYFESEGRSRDGRMSEIRSAALRHLLKSSAKGELEYPVYIIPAANSYDWTIEADTLSKEKGGIYNNVIPLLIHRDSKITGFCSVGEPWEIHDLMKEYGNDLRKVQDVLKEEILNQSKLFPQHLFLYSLQHNSDFSEAEENIFAVATKKLENDFYAVTEGIPRHNIDTFHASDVREEIKRAEEWANKWGIIDSTFGENVVYGTVKAPRLRRYFGNTAQEILEHFHVS